MFKFSLFGFPVQVQPWFWLVAFLLGGGFQMSGTFDWLPVLEWMTVIFLSLLAHELGHAVAVRRFGGWPVIVIHSLGGTTYYENRFNRKERLMVSAAGPAFSLMLMALSAALVFTGVVPPFLREITRMMMWINGVWTVFNLLPVLPMDGGQILRDVLGPRHFRLSCVIGMLTAVIIGVVLLKFGWIFAALLLGFMAFQNYQALRQ
ncbi:MAG: site-2 protease family protein [Verrucomicrobiales bacterium]|jgi:Zn-dependent protease|nr:site-2 protease family protein [Verrucomicrobiales bacterium]